MPYRYSGSLGDATGLGREGEIIAANVRLLVAVAAVLLAFAQLAFSPHDREPRAAIAATTAFLTTAGLLSLLARRDPPPPGLGVAACLVDVGVITLFNASFVLAGVPLAATNGRVVYATYLLALALSGLRHDPRLSLLSGLLAAVGYCGTVGWALVRYHLLGGLHDPAYGYFRWDNQLARLVILALATYVNVAIAQQSRRHLAASLQDGLTGLPNRRFAEQVGRQALAQAERSGRQPVLALCDLDHFKSVNDRYGHDVGDRALAAVADLLRHSFRSSDVQARIGGEEFLLFFPEGDAAGAIARIGEFHRRLAEADLLPGRPGVSLTASIGIATYPRDGATWATLFHVADRRLYMAKTRGRARIVDHSGPEDHRSGAFLVGLGRPVAR